MSNNEWGYVLFGIAPLFAVHPDEISLLFSAQQNLANAPNVNFEPMHTASEPVVIIGGDHPVVTTWVERAEMQQVLYVEPIGADFASDDINFLSPSMDDKIQFPAGLVTPVAGFLFKPRRSQCIKNEVLPKEAIVFITNRNPAPLLDSFQAGSSRAIRVSLRISKYSLTVVRGTWASAAMFVKFTTVALA